MIAVSFGDYASSLFIGTGAAKAWSKLFASPIAVAMGVLNVKGVRGVDKARSAIVVTLLIVSAPLGDRRCVKVATMNSSPASRSPSSPISASQ